MTKRSKQKKALKSQKRAPTSSVEVKAFRGSHRWLLFIPIDPVPASRPRFSRAGRDYYGRKYTAFRKASEEIFESTRFPRSFPLDGLLAVSATVCVTKPKYSKRNIPLGDVDNYFKTLDVLNGVVWVDDDQLVWASMSKEFAERPGILLEVARCERVPKTRALSEVWLER